MCTAIFLVPPTWNLRDQTQEFGKWLIASRFEATEQEYPVFLFYLVVHIMLSNIR
jgi:hypothetical protein